jgi:hypothetical protein
MQFNTYEYIEPEFKEVITTSEYAAQHFHRMGWMWGRLEVMREQQTWGAARANLIEKDLREKIAQEIEAQIESLSLQDGLFKSGMIGACAIVRGNNDRS